MERKYLMKKARVFIQRQFKSSEPSQTVEDLKMFWEGGPALLDDWFEWLTGGTKLGSLTMSATQQLKKVINIVEQFLLSKRGDEYEMELKQVKDTAEEDNGNLTMYHIFLLRDLAKLFKNKAEKLIFLDGKDDKKFGPEEQIPNIFVTKQNTFGASEFEEKVLIHLRIGDKVVNQDVLLGSFRSTSAST